VDSGLVYTDIGQLTRHRADLAPREDVASSEEVVSRPFATQRLSDVLLRLDNVINVRICDQGGATLND
jgi:hypothetical protein